MKWWLSILLVLSFGAFALDAPVLHEINIEGSVSAPEILLAPLSLELKKEYLFVVNNTHPVAFNIQFDKFGQHVFTRYLQGSSNVSQESINVLPNGKVLWHFTASLPGEFSLYVVNPATMQQSEKRKLVIIDPSVVVPAVEAGKKGQEEKKGWMRAKTLTQ